MTTIPREQAAKCAYEAYRRRILRGLERWKKPPTFTPKPWGQLSPMVRDAWLAAVDELDGLLNPPPREQVLRELAIEGKIALRIATDDE